MIKTESNNWKIEVKENGHKRTAKCGIENTVFITTNDSANSLMIHLCNDGSVDVRVHSHQENDSHAEISKWTHRLKQEDGTPFTTKSTKVSCQKTSLTLVKFDK